MFQNAITQTKDLSSCSVHEAVNYRHNTVHIQNNFNNGLLDAATCMNRIIYRGPKSSKRVYAECKAARTEARKRWRKFRSEERNTEKVEEIRERGEKHGKGGGNSGVKRSTEKVEEIQEQREARKRWRKFRSKEKHGKGGGSSGAKRSTEKVEKIQE